jgi:hypothetical protein
MEVKHKEQTTESHYLNIHQQHNYLTVSTSYLTHIWYTEYVTAMPPLEQNLINFHDTQLATLPQDSSSHTKHPDSTSYISTYETHHIRSVEGGVLGLHQKH